MGKWLYEPKVKTMRAARLRRDAVELESKGYTLFAADCREHADMLDPAPRTTYRDDRGPRRAPGTKPPAPRKVGADLSRVGGQRDAAPRAAMVRR